MTLQSNKYLDDILYAIELIETFILEISSFADYESDKKTSSAVERQLGIIGEAVNKFDKINQNEVFARLHRRRKSTRYHS